MADKVVGVGSGVGVAVGVGVLVGGTGVGVLVGGTGVGVLVGGTGVAVGVGVLVDGTGVAVGVGVLVGGTGVDVGVAVGVGVLVGGTGVDVGVAVGVSVLVGGTGVDVGVAVGVGSGSPHAANNRAAATHSRAAMRPMAGQRFLQERKKCLKSHLSAGRTGRPTRAPEDVVLLHPASMLSDVSPDSLRWKLSTVTQSEQGTFVPPGMKTFLG